MLSSVIRDQIKTYFNKTELRDLCFDLGINHEVLSGDSIEDQARELVAYCQRHALVANLTKRCQELRPHINWEISIGVDIETHQPSEKGNSITIDSSPLLGPEKGRVVQLPYAASKTVDKLLDEIYFSQRPHIAPYTYRTEWILQDTESGKTYRAIGTRWAKEHGQERDNRSLAEVGIKSGMRFEIVRPRE